jgi:hypothetical protein
VVITIITIVKTLGIYGFQGIMLNATLNFGIVILLKAGLSS